MDKRCGTCRYWNPGEKAKFGSLKATTQDPWCTVWKVVKYEEEKPKSWCWKPKKEDKDNG